jgi:hypothetical protein
MLEGSGSGTLVLSVISEFLIVKVIKGSFFVQYVSPSFERYGRSLWTLRYLFSLSKLRLGGILCLAGIHYRAVTVRLFYRNLHASSRLYNSRLQRTGKPINLTHDLYLNTLEQAKYENVLFMVINISEGEREAIHI